MERMPAVPIGTILKDRIFFDPIYAISGGVVIRPACGVRSRPARL
jgi:hypothetical protein